MDCLVWDSSLYLLLVMEQEVKTLEATAEMYLLDTQAHLLCLGEECRKLGLS